MIDQFDSHGRLRHLLSLAALPVGALTALLDQAEQYVRPPGAAPARSRALRGLTVANLFFEPSTRTRASFELAAVRMGADVLNLDVKLSSRAKGEGILDTIYTLQAMAVDIMVLRDSEPGVPAMIAEHVAEHVSVLNGGEACLSHPTQGLLDTLTIRQAKGQLEGLRVAIVGDIRHSRVARSAAEILCPLGVAELRLVAPRRLQPEPEEFPGCPRYDDVAEGIADADVIMTLRIQRERIPAAELPEAHEYFERWGLTPQRLTLAQPDCIVLHPGPMNRGVEIDSAVADGPQSYITRQVTNGVAVRMAILAQVAESIAARRSA